MPEGVNELLSPRSVRAIALHCACTKLAQSPMSQRDLLARADEFAEYILTGKSPPETRR